MPRTKYINFGEWGWPLYMPITQHELTLLWQGASDIADRYTGTSIDSMDQIMSQRLVDYILIYGEPDEAWLGTAAFLTALRGVRHGIVPDMLDQE